MAEGELISACQLLEQAEEACQTWLTDPRSADMCARECGAPATRVFRCGGGNAVAC